MIDIGIDIRKPELDLRLPAEPRAVPVVRQAVRALGEATRADPISLEGAELAVTEACGNVVEHAYGSHGGPLEVTIRPSLAELLVTVRDSGRGMPEDPRREGRPGLGLGMIEEIATQLEIRPGQEGGTEVIMRLSMGEDPLCLNGSAGDGAAPVERIARRIVAVIGAQTDMPSDRLLESLLAVEIATRHAPRYLVGDRIELSLERLTEGFELGLGPLVSDGARAVVQESELPVIGAVIDRLSDHIGIEPIADEPGHGPPGAERLRLRIGSPSAGSA